MQSCLCRLALNEVVPRLPDAALTYSREAKTFAQELAFPISLVQAQAMHAMICHTARDYTVAERWIDKAITSATKGGFPYWQMLGLLMKASILVYKGQKELGLIQFDQVYRAYRESGARVGAPWLLALRGEMLAKNDQTDQGLRAVEEALACIEETGERYHEAEVHRLKGELLLLQGKVTQPHWRKSVSKPAWTSPAAGRRRRWSCAQRPVWRSYIWAKVAGKKLSTFSERFMLGSVRVSSRETWQMRATFW